MTGASYRVALFQFSEERRSSNVLRIPFYLQMFQKMIFFFNLFFTSLEIQWMGANFALKKH